MFEKKPFAQTNCMPTDWGETYAAWEEWSKAQPKIHADFRTPVPLSFEASVIFTTSSSRTTPFFLLKVSFILIPGSYTTLVKRRLLVF